MKQFLTVLYFELTHYFKSKGYVLTTILVSALLIVGLSLPSVFDMSQWIPSLEETSSEEKDKPKLAFSILQPLIT